MVANIDNISISRHRALRIHAIDPALKTAKNAIRVLREFTQSSPKLGVSDLARRLDLDRATVHRMLRTLYEERMIDQDPDTRLYRLGSGVLELAHAFLRQHGVAEVAKPELEKLRDATGETVALQVLDAKESVCVATSESRHSVRVAYVIGERMPLHCTSSGAVFLANMPPAIRKAMLAGKLQKYTPKTIVDVEKILRFVEQSGRTGIGVADETYHNGTRTISAPVIDATGATIAAVTIAGPVQRLSSKMLMKLARPLQRTADVVSAQIAHSSSSAMSE
jgi:DNA-binding IclR family transcriptional regulator